MSQSMKLNIETVRREITEAAQRVRRNSNEIRLIAVTKTLSLDTIKSAYELGLREFGENRVQELAPKYEEFPEAQWHMIGHLQRNKVKYIIEKAKMIQSLDSIKLAEEINKRAGAKGIVKDVLVQVNVAGEDSKFGLDLIEIQDFIEEVKDFTNLKVRGLMTVAPYVDDPEEVRPVFKNLKQKFELIKAMGIPGVNMEHLSMGMSNDYIVAVEEGATLVRIGTKIFGERS